MAVGDPTSAEQEAAISTIVANGWASESAVRSFVASEGGPRTSVRRILTAFTPNPGADAVAAGSAIDPGIVTTTSIAAEYAKYQAAGRVDPSGYYATPTPVALQNDSYGPVNSGDSRITGAGDFISRPASYAVATPEDRTSPASGVPTIINAPGIPMWALVAAAALLVYLFMERR